MRRVILSVVALAALTVSANAGSRLQELAGGFAVEPRASPSRLLIPVQAFDPDACRARCQRTHNYCLQLVKDLARGALRGDPDLLQLQTDKCETNFENCARGCAR
jgi:hypothetical protein